MSRSAGSLLILIILLLLSGHASGQEQRLPVKRWIRQLSVKEDILTRNFRAVLDEIQALDSVTARRGFQELEKRGPGRSKRFQIRLKALHGFMNNPHFLPPGADPVSPSLFEEAILMAFELNDELLVADACQWYAYFLSQNFRKNIGKYSFYAVAAAEMQDKNGEAKHYNIALCRYLLGHLMYHTQEYEKALAYSQQALEWRLDTIRVPDDTTNVFYVMNAWNTIGLSLQKLGRYDEAFTAFDSATLWADRGGHRFWKGLLAGNRGDTWFLKGEYDKAMPLLMYDYTISKEMQVWDNTAISLEFVARINLLKGEPQLALTQLYEARDILQQMPNVYDEVNILFAIADAWKALGRIDSGLIYTQRSQELQSVVERERAQARSDISRLRLSEQESIYKVQLMAREKSRINLIRNFSITLIVLASALGYLYMHRQRLRLRLKEQQALEQKRLAEAETLHAREQLRQFTQSLLEKSEMIEKLMEQVNEKHVAEEQKQIIADLSHATILTEEDWERFKDLFEQVYPGFFLRLREKAYGITLAEQRMAALHRLQLTTREAAAILAVSQDAIHKTRSRLRQRLHPMNEEEIDTFIASL